MVQKTSLYNCHKNGGGTIVDFAGYLLPVQYPTGIIAEHNAVRTAAGLFDVSHMGEIVVHGKDALKNINRILTNDFSSMDVGQVRYSVICNDRGGCVDDVLVYRLNENDYLIVANASNRHKDFNWIRGHAFGEVKVEDISDNVSQIAIQGPRAIELIRRFVPEEDIPKKYYTFRRNVKIQNYKFLISRTGYTGEDGFELYSDNYVAPEIWDFFLKAGKEMELGLIPCGLGARDTLRLEAAMPLYGHEMNDDISPLETALAFGVKMNKEDFIGKKALVERGEPKIKRIGLKITGRGIAREQQDVYVGDTLIGRTTSGTHAPFLKYPIAMALVDKEYAAVGTQVAIDVRGRRIEAEIVELPFYKRLNK
jgi:aminomethyltransferase